MISASILVLELALIRVVPAEVHSVSYFTNLILIASFFGLGFGCISESRRSFAWMLPAGLLLNLIFILVFRGIVVYEDAASVHFWINNSSRDGIAMQVPLFLSIMLAFVAAAVPFTALGQQLARSMNEYPRLAAYSWDIAGSIIGIVLFSLSSLLSTPPWIWTIVVGIAWALLFAKSRAHQICTMLASLLFSFLAYSPHDWTWSPYYFIKNVPSNHGLSVYVNSSFHQFAIDYENDDPELQKFQSDMKTKFSTPYQIYRDNHGQQNPKSVLILGAGTGNDVNIALINMAESVTAIEIDPVILALGHAHNTSKPYQDPRVTTVIDDARHYLRTSKESFDLIVLGTLDSQTLLSGNSNVRLENYVYTAESFVDMKKLLKPDGLMATYYSVYKHRSPWLYDRLYATMNRAFGDHLALIQFNDQQLFNTIIIGSLDKLNGLQPFNANTAIRPTTDDWPFLYLEKPMISTTYLQLIGVFGVLILFIFHLLRVTHRGQGMFVNFFFLGVGFTLVESAAIVRMALIFGSTWVVSAIVFTSVLVTIFIGNLLVIKERALKPSLAWSGLFVAILINYAVPLQHILELPWLMRSLISGTMIGLPILFASFCFSHLFKRQATTGFALGLNLIGAMSGGFVEYLSMIIGMRSLWLVILVIYLMALLTSKKNPN